MKGPARTEASLRGHLENPNEKKDDKAGDKKDDKKGDKKAPAKPAPASEDDDQDEAMPPPAKGKDAKGNAEIAEDDYQLAYALDLIKGLALTQKKPLATP